MRPEDNMMPVLTGLVFAVVLGTTVQNSEGVMSFFAGPSEIQVDDDVFFVRAGRDTDLDVLANDYSGKQLTGADIQIVSVPDCGQVTTSENGIQFVNSEECKGTLSFEYCVSDGETCAPAKVAMNVRQARVSIAATSVPGDGELVPLPEPTRESLMRFDPGPMIEGQTPVLQAFAVTLEPRSILPERSLFLDKETLSRYQIELSANDLTNQPISEPELLTQLGLSKIPVNADNSARFLVDYSSDSWSIGMERAAETDNEGPSGRIDLVQDASSQG